MQGHWVIVVLAFVVCAQSREVYLGNTLRRGTYLNQLSGPVLIMQPYEIQARGIITKFHVIVQPLMSKNLTYARDLDFVVLRKRGGLEDTYQIAHTHHASLHTRNASQWNGGNRTITLEPDKTIPVIRGDRIGFVVNGNGKHVPVAAVYFGNNVKKILGQYTYAIGITDNSFSFNKTHKQNFIFSFGVSMNTADRGRTAEVKNPVNKNQNSKLKGDPGTVSTTLAPVTGVPGAKGQKGDQGAKGEPGISNMAKLLTLPNKGDAPQDLNGSEYRRLHHGDCDSLGIYNDCDQICWARDPPIYLPQTNEYYNYQCSCLEGYILLGTKTCRDQDECAYKNGGCQGHCENTMGSYTCKCPTGFSISKDEHSCTARLLCGTRWDTCSELSPQAKCVDTYGDFLCIADQPVILRQYKPGTCKACSRIRSKGIVLIIVICLAVSTILSVALTGCMLMTLMEYMSKK